MTSVVGLLPPAVRWLVGAGRAALHTTIRDLEIGPAPPDAAAVALRHNMVFWLAAHADTMGLAPKPHDALKSDVHLQAAAALAAVRQLVEATDALESRGIRTVSIKGPLYAQWLYGSLGARRFVDLDLLVEPASAARALQILRELGYRLPHYATTDTAKVIFAGRAAYPLSREGALDIDLHWRLADTKFTSALEPATVLDAAIAVPVAAASLRIPCPTHAALISLQHAAKHGWCGLEMILGLAFLLRRTDVEWRDVQTAARSAGGEAAMLAGLRLAHDCYGLSVPSLDEVSAPTLDRLQACAVENLSAPAGVHADWRAERALHRASMDRRRDRWKYDLLRLVMPTPLEAQWRPLPARAARLYAPLRLIRLGARALGATARRRLL